MRPSFDRVVDAQLRKMLPAGVLESFPEFPPPRHFSDNLNDEENIKTRFEELRVYFCRVLTTPAVLRSEEGLTALGLKDLYVPPAPRVKRDPAQGPRIRACPELADTTVPPAAVSVAIKSVRRRPKPTGIEVHDETGSSDGGSSGHHLRFPWQPASNTTTPGLLSGPSPMVRPLRLVDQAIEWRHQAKQWWTPTLVQDDPEYGGNPLEDPDAALQLQWTRPRSARAAQRSALDSDVVSSRRTLPRSLSEPGTAHTSEDEGWDIASSTGASSPTANGSRSPHSNRSRSGSSVSRSTTTDGTDGDGYVAELENELAGGAAASRAWIVADECAAAGYGTAARRAAIFKAMAEEFPSPISSGRLKVKPGTNPRAAQAEFEDLLSHPFEWVVMAYMYRMNINDLGDDVDCKVLSPTPESMTQATDGENQHGNEIKYQLRISIPYGVQLVAKRAELPMNERAVFDPENRTLKTFVTLPLWTDSIGFLEYVEYRAVSPHETYFRKGIVVELAHPRFPPRAPHCSIAPALRAVQRFLTISVCVAFRMGCGVRVERVPGEIKGVHACDREPGLHGRPESSCARTHASLPQHAGRPLIV